MSFLNLRFVLIGSAFLAFSANADEPNRLAVDHSSAQAEFVKAFKPYCGNAYAATIVDDSAPSPDWDHPLVVHIRDCEDSVVRMPLHVGDDRSRTWVLTLHSGFIDFQHYHLHEDGSPDAVSPYGGQTQSEGTATRQAFPVDQASKTLFLEQGLDVSITNTWTIEFPDNQTMRYQLSRPGRLFVLEVDLSESIPLPPPAWGYSP